MPLFEYLCQDCGVTFEKIVPRHDSAAECPGCESGRVEKQLSVFAVSGGQTSGGDFADAGPGCGRCGAAQPGSCSM